MPLVITTSPGAGPAVRSSRDRPGRDLEVFTQPKSRFWAKETDPLTPVMLVARQASAEAHPGVETRAEAATQLVLGSAQTALDALSELDPDKTPVEAMLALNELVRATGGKISKVSVTNRIKMMLKEDVDPMCDCPPITSPDPK